MEIGIITMEKYENREPGSVGSSRIRGDWIAKYWKRAEIYQPGKKYDVLIFQKAYWKDMVANFKGIKIFDICDPDWLDHRPVVEMINQCDAVVTPTEPLAKQLRLFDIGKTQVRVIPDRVDLEWSAPQHKKHKKRATSVVYFGYHHNTGVLDAAIEPIKKRGLSLTVISDQPHPENDFFVKYNVETVNEEIVRHDVVLLPNAPSSNYRFQFKSNNKTIQSWALRMPVARDASELDKFMSAAEREREAQKRVIEVVNKWDVKISVEEWEDVLKEVRYGKR